MTGRIAFKFGVSLLSSVFIFGHNSREILRIEEYNKQWQRNLSQELPLCVNPCFCDGIFRELSFCVNPCFCGGIFRFPFIYFMET